MIKYSDKNHHIFHIVNFSAIITSLLICVRKQPIIQLHGDETCMSFWHNSNLHVWRRCTIKRLKYCINWIHTAYCVLKGFVNRFSYRNVTSKCVPKLCYSFCSPLLCCIPFFFLFHFRRGSFSIIQMIKVELMRVSVTRVLNELFVTQNSLTLAMNAVVVNEALYVNAKEGYSHYRTKASCSFE